MNDVLFSWIHLSDIHGGHGDVDYQEDQRWSLRAVLDVLDTVPESSIPKINAIFLTGDVGFSASPKQYELAQKSIADIRQRLDIPPERVFVVPGNHDVDRAVAAPSSPFAAVLEQARAGASPVSAVLQSDRASFLKRFEAYRSFVGVVAPQLAKQMADDCSWHVDLRAEGLEIRLLGLNTALLAQDDKDNGQLRIGEKQISPLNDDRAPNRVVLTLGHHPLSWLGDNPPIVERVRRYSDAYLHGHVHTNTSELAIRGGGDQALTLIAGAVHVDPREAKGHIRDGFNIGAIVARPRRVRVAPYVRQVASFVLDTTNVPPNRLYAEHPLRNPPPTAVQPAVVVSPVVADQPLSPVRTFGASSTGAALSPTSAPVATPAQLPPPFAHQSPLDVYVAWHPSYGEGPEIARRLYALLHRDPTAPFEAGVEIPVYYRTVLGASGISPPIGSRAVETAVVVLADETMARDESWKAALRALAGDGEHRHLYVVALHDLALKIRGVNDRQFIRLVGLSALERDNDLSNRLAHLLTRQMIAEDRSQLAEPVKVFMSHAKADGEEIMLRLRTFLQSDDSQLDTFYDRRNITPGERYASEIDRAIADPRALLLVVLTDVFETRRVCHEEVAKAMLERRPIVAVDARTASLRQNSEYLGPVPILPYHPDDPDFWRLLLRTILLQALRFAYLPPYLASIERLYGGTGENSLYMARKPVLGDVGGPKQYLRLLHPDPPLFDDERALFGRVFAQLRLATPSTLPLELP